MNDYQMGKLRKQLARKNELLKQEREDRQYTQKKLVQIQAQRDKYHGELLMARQTINNIDQIIQQNVKQMKVKLEQENQQALSQMHQIKDKLLQEQLLNENLAEETRRKDVVIAELSAKLKEISRNNKDPTLLINTKEISEQATITNNQFRKLTEKYNRLCNDMENIMAQNKILRKLHGVPDNFGFDLEEIKIAQRQQLQDYKGQCRKLQAEIEELEAERTQLRYRLRQYHTFYSNKGERYKDLTQKQFELLDAYAMNLKQGKVQLPQIDHSQRQMQRQILSLRAKIELLQDRRPTNMMGGKLQNTQADSRKMQQYLKEMLEPIAQDIQKLSKFKQQPNNQSTLHKIKEDQGIQLQADRGIHHPPIPLPIAHNDWSKIKEGYSYTHSSKIPVNLKNYENQVGFDAIRAKYQIAALQLQNIQSLKLLKEKQKYENILSQQLLDLKSKYQKCLKVQDELFVRYFQQKQQVNDKIKGKEIQNINLMGERDQLHTKLSIIEQTYNLLLAKTDVEQKLKDYGIRLSKSEAQAVQFERKNHVWNQEYQMLRQTYSKMEKRAIQTEYDLKQKYLRSHQNQQQLTFLTNKILQQNKGAVSADVHNAVVSRLQATNEKSAKLSFRETELRLQISRLQSIEREINIKDQTIESLREDSMELLLELQILRNRLQSIDTDYRGYRELFQKLVQFINDNNVSLVSSFKKFDRDNSGNLTKQQFMNALKALGFRVSNNEIQTLFSEFDLDGSNQITYKQFVRKLRRGGVISRSRQEEAVYSLFKAIKHAKISIRSAFTIIDMDSSNSISKSQMQTAFRKIGIRTSSEAIDYIFKVCDIDMDGTISCNELQKMFNEIIKESAIQEKQMFTQEMDWKMQFVLKIQQCSIKYNNSLKDTFKQLDQDHSSYLSIQQLTDFLKKAGVQLEKNYLRELFDFLDRTKDGRIQFSEFLKVLEEAKREKKRIQRIKFVKKRVEELKKENQVNGTVQGNQRHKIGEQTGLKVRLMAMQTKHGNLLKKKDRLIHSLASKEQYIIDLERSLSEQENTFEKLQNQYFQNKQQLSRLQEKSKHSLGQQQSKKVRGQYQRLNINKKELTTELDKYKGLYEATSDKNKGYELRLGKIESQLNKCHEMIKDFQSESDEMAKIGSLQMENEYSKRNEKQIGKKYDSIVEQIRKIDKHNKLLITENQQREKQVMNFHIFAQQKSDLQQRNIDNLKAKFLPSISLNKIEQLTSKVREVAISKTKLQQENKLLREKNYNIQIRNDYLQNEKIFVEQMQRKLRRTFPDEASITIMDLTKKLSEYKMSELKAKREANLLREKQEYYTRVNNANTDAIRSMQEELAHWEIKHNEREQFWRNRLNDQLNLVEEIQKEANKAKQDNLRAQKYFTQQSYQPPQSDSHSKKSEKSVIFSHEQNSEGNIQLHQTIQQLQAQLLQKQKQLYKYKTTLQQMAPQIKFTDMGNQMGISTNSFVMQTTLTGSQIRNNAKKVITSQQNVYQQEAAKITQAAQQSIDTLQRIIDDKNQQIKRKDKIVEELKKTVLRDQQDSCQEMHRLNEEIRELKNKNQINSLNTIMNRSTQRNLYTANTDQKLEELVQAIDHKDHELHKLQTKYDNLYISRHGKATSESTNDAKLQRKLRELQQQRETQKKRNTENETRLKKKIQNLQKLSKDKDIKLGKLQQALMQIKNDVVNEKKERAEDHLENTMGQFINQINKGSNNNDSKMEIMLQKSMQTIQEMTKKNKNYENQINRLREENKMGRTRHR